MRVAQLTLVALASLAACRGSSTKKPPPNPDAPPSPDAPMPDGAPDTSAEIAAARAAADGAVALPIDAATVTYVAPAVGGDAAGFFIQAAQQGPALFVAVDPSTLTPAPVAGDTVSFHITDMATLDGQRRADMIDSFSVSGSGADLSGLVQDLSSSTDLITNVDGYDSELVTVTATVTSGFSSAAAGHVAASIDTAGLTASGLKFRLPTTVEASLDLASACAITIGPTPLWRFNTSPEPSAWVAADVHVTSCPAPKVVSAVATTATTMKVTFDRVIDPASVAADGSQFTFDNGLTASAATASGKVVTVTTGTEAPVMYTVTVASTVKDLYASGLDATAASTTFFGFQILAGLAITEVDPNITGSHDLVELVATSDGSLNGVKLVQDITTPITLATLPNLTVATGDVIVVHLNPVTATTETTTKTDCADAACYAGAWDVNGGTSGITFSNRILSLIAPDGTVDDVVPFAKAGTTSPSGFPADLQSLQTAGTWLPADCGGAPCDYTTTPLASDATISVDWSMASSSATGMSVQRKNGQFTKTTADWTLATQTFGTANN